MVECLSSFSKQALESPDLMKRYAELGATAWWSNRADTVAYRAKAEARLAPIVMASSARVE